MGRSLLLGAVLAAVAGGGCTPAHLWFLARGEEKKPADYPLKAKEGKKGVTVVIISTAAPTLALDFAGADRELAGLLARKLQNETKKADAPITVVDQAKVDKYLATHPNWKASSPGRIAKELGADYLIDMTLASASMFQPDFGREVYAGRATVAVTGYDAETPGAPAFEYVQNSQSPPKDGAAPVVAYRQFFMDRIATELAWRHVDHAPERELSPLK